MTHRIIAVPTSVAEAVRTSRESPGYGHPVSSEIARGHGPCRHCLRTFRVGEDRRLLFTYDPFAGLEPLPLPGPVFIHEVRCPRHPEEAALPDALLEHRLTLNAYGQGRRLRAQEYVSGDRFEHVVERLLARPSVDYVHVHDTEAGCYDFRVEPASPLS